MQRGDRPDRCAQRRYPDSKPLTMLVASPAEFSNTRAAIRLQSWPPNAFCPVPSAARARPAFISDESTPGSRRWACAYRTNPWRVRSWSASARCWQRRTGGVAKCRTRLDDRERAAALRPRIVDRGFDPPARATASRGRGELRTAHGTASARSNARTVKVRPQSMRRLLPVLAIAGALLAATPSRLRLRVRPPRRPHDTFHVGVWTVHASLLDVNFKDGDFSTPKQVTMTRGGGDITADRASGNYKSKARDALRPCRHARYRRQLRRHLQHQAREIARTLDLTADQVHIDGVGKIYTATGHVHYVQADTTVDADNGVLNDFTHELDLKATSRSCKAIATCKRVTCSTIRVSGQAHAEDDVTMQFPSDVNPHIATPRPIHITNRIASDTRRPKRRRRLRRRNPAADGFALRRAGGAARRAHAAANARRVRRAGRYRRRRPRAAPRDRERPHPVDDPVGSAGHRQDDARRNRRAFDGAHFEKLSAVSAGVADLRRVVAEAQGRRRVGGRTVLFIDEIHRFNKAQQDAILPYVEDGTVTLIGATTENPSFEVNSALLSRARVFVLHSLSDDEIGTIVDRALADPQRGLGGRDDRARTRGARDADRLRQRRRAHGALGAGVRGIERTRTRR